MFNKLSANIKGHIKGYITDGDVTNNPVDSVHDCNNMDFFPAQDKRRVPISLLHDLSSSLPANFKIIDYAEKSFISSDGVKSDVLIVIARNLVSPDKTKIYLKNYYCPDTDYQNSYKTSGFGWNTDFIELTEYYRGGESGVTVEGGSWDIGGIIYNLRSDTAIIHTGRNQNYYKGFTAIATGHIIGMCTASITSGGYGYFKIALNPGETADVDAGVCRFPVNMHNAGNWADITETTIEAEMPNLVKIACGHESRTLWLGFLQKKNFFGIAAQSIVESGGGADDLKIAATKNTLNATTTFTVKITYTGSGGIDYDRFVWKKDSGSWSVEDVVSNNNPPRSLSDNVKVYWETFYGHPVDQQWVITFQKNSDAWDGFWFSFDQPVITEKLLYFLLEPGTGEYSHIVDSQLYELGIKVHFIFYNTSGSAQRRAFSICARLDEFQEIFLKNIVVTNDAGSVTLKHCYVEFLYSYDRRLSHFDVFGGENNDFEPKDTRNNEVFPTYRFSNGQDVSVLDNGIKTEDDLFAVVVFDLYPNDYGLITKFATGLSLNAYLNQYYWKDIDIKCKQLIKLSDLMVAVNISNDSLTSEGENVIERKNGSIAVGFNNIQNGNISALSIFSTERMREISKTGSLIGGVSLLGNQFMLFTSTEMIWVEVTNWKNLLFRVMRNFLHRGTLNKRCIVKAEVDGVFGGIYWLNYESIFRFVNNEPEDLLVNRWREEYQKISTAAKDAAIMGFLPDSREVFVYLNSKIYIFNLIYNHWKIYTYPVAPEIFRPGLSGAILFSNTNKVYRTEPKTTAIGRDLNTTKIDFGYDQYISHGSSLEHKIFDNIELRIDVAAATGIEE